MQVTRAQFVDMPSKFGGDLWNVWKLWNVCFSNAGVQAARYSSIGTGLWVDVELLINGTWQRATAYDGGRIMIRN
jgi:hypothetical protein